jgi:ATP-dependent helicase/nuclease subunit B
LDATLYQLLQQGATLLTASRHLAHALQLEYATAAQAQGLSVWPTPRILPWSTYLRSACQQHRSQQINAPRLLSEQQSLALWERIVADSEAGKTLLNPSQAARNAQRSWRRLHQHQIPLRKVGAWPGEEAQVFNAWAQQFIDRTQAQHWLDSARFADFLHDTQFKPDTDLIIYGFDQLTPDMQRLLQAWQVQDVVIHYLKSTDQHAQVQLCAAKDSQVELKQAAHWARSCVEAGVQRIAVVAPRLTAQAAQVQRRFTDVFAPAQRCIDVAAEATAFHVAATPPLASYPLVHHALLLLQLLQGRADVLLVGQLLRSPFFAGYDQEASLRATAELKAREERREYWNGNELERLADVNGCSQLASCIRATQNYLRDHKSNELPSEWTERFTQLLRLSGWPRGRVFDSNEQQCFNKLQQLLAELSALDELLGKISFTTAIATLRDACNAESFAPEGVDQAVTIIDADSIAGMQFDALWVMGLHAGEWPPAPEPDPFLPIELQREYALPDASAELCLHLARHKLQRLVNAAKQVVLSWPEHDDDAELRPSPLLDEYVRVSSPGQRSIASVRPEPVEGRKENISLATQLFTARPTLETFVDDFAPPQLPGAAKGGTRIVELQSRCPFRAQAELRLHATPVASVSPAVEATERGQLVHRVLKEVWERLKDSQGLQAADMSALAEQVRAIAARVAQQVIPATTIHRQRLAALEVELCSQWIMRLLELERTRLPFRVQRSEQTETYELAGMTINIQLDRVDELADGGLLLIDYKTGDSNFSRDWLDQEPGRPRSPQLPLYALVHRKQLAGIAFAVLAPGKAEFRGLADTDSIAPGIADYAQLKASKQLPGVASWDELLQHWQQVLEVLARQYLSGEAYVKPLQNECTYCHLHSLCRVHELLEGAELETEEEGSDA